MWAAAILLGEESSSFMGLATLFGDALFSWVGNLMGLLGLGLAAKDGPGRGAAFDLITPCPLVGQNSKLTKTTIFGYKDTKHRERRGALTC